MSEKTVIKEKIEVLEIFAELKQFESKKMRSYERIKVLLSYLKENQRALSIMPREREEILRIASHILSEE